MIGRPSTQPGRPSFFQEDEMTVRAKFQVQSITEQQGGLKTVQLHPVTSGSPENAEFFKWTPSGSIQLGVLNPAAAEQFKPGDVFYVDFTPAS